MMKNVSWIAAVTAAALALRLVAEMAGGQAALVLALLGAFAALYAVPAPAPKRSARPADVRESRMGDLLGARATTAFGDL